MRKVLQYFKCRKLCPSVARWLAAAVLALGARQAPAQTHTMTSASLSQFTNYLNSGGTIVFAFDGTLATTNPLVISINTVLETVSNNVTISGGNLTRIFQVRPGVSLTLSNLTISGGNVTGTNGAAGAAGASGVNTGNNGGNGAGATNSQGGAIYNEGTNIAIGCIFVTNTVAGGNGGNGGNGGDGSSHSGTGGLGGNGGTGFGGAIYNLGHVLLSNCTFAGNTALGGNGGSGGTNGNGPFGYAGRGGAGATAAGAGLYNLGTALVTNCTFNQNAATGGNSQSAGGVLTDHGDGPNGSAGGWALGAGVFNSGTNTFLNCSFFENAATGGAGGDAGSANNGFGNGGNGGSGGSALGGGLYNELGGTLVVTNGTFASDMVTGGTGGTNGTGVSPGNPGATGAVLGANLANNGGSLGLRNSILAYSTNGLNAYGTIADQGNNLSSDATPAFTTTNSFNNRDPLLGTLAANGGPTLTMALNTGSPAIDAIYDNSAPAFDQRGMPRPAGARSDVGAFEVQPGFATATITGPGLENGPFVQLVFVGSSNTTYRIQVLTNLTSGNWVDVATNVTDDTGTIYYGERATNFPRRFFRAITP